MIRFALALWLSHAVRYCKTVLSATEFEPPEISHPRYNVFIFNCEYLSIWPTAFDGANRTRAVAKFGLLDFFSACCLFCLTLLISAVPSCRAVLHALTQGRMSSLSIDGVTLSNAGSSTPPGSDWGIAARPDSHARGRAGPPQNSRGQKRIPSTRLPFKSPKPRQKALLAILERANFEIRPIDEALAKTISGKGITEQIGRIFQGAVGSGFPSKTIRS